MRLLDARKVRRHIKLAAKVSPALEQELVAGINLYGYLRKAVREEIVGPARIAVAETWRRDATVAEQAVMEREAQLAVIACATISDSSGRIRGIKTAPSSIVEIAVRLIQVDSHAAEAAGNCGRAISAIYSSMPDEALSQLVAAWGAALQIDSPEFRPVVFGSRTLENWGAFREFIGGALTGIGRASYRSIKQKAVEIIVGMPQPQRQLTLQAIERIVARKRVAGVSEGSKERAVDVPAVGSPEWKQTNAIFFLSPSDLTKTETEIDLLVNAWLKKHPINQLPWRQVLGPNFDKLVGPTFAADAQLLSFAVLLGVAASEEPRFFNCRVHKQWESEFFRQKAAALDIGGMNRQLLEAPIQEQAKQTFDMMAGVEMLQRIRSAAWHYADPKRPASSEAERLARLSGGTALMRQMVADPAGQSFVLGLISTMVESASASLANLIKEYRVSLTSD